MRPVTHLRTTVDIRQHHTNVVDVLRQCHTRQGTHDTRHLARAQRRPDTCHSRRRTFLQHHIDLMPRDTPILNERKQSNMSLSFRNWEFITYCSAVARCASTRLLAACVRHTFVNSAWIFVVTIVVSLLIEREQKSYF